MMYSITPPYPGFAWRDIGLILEEADPTFENIDEITMQNSFLKAKVVSDQLKKENLVVIGADTLVVLITKNFLINYFDYSGKVFEYSTTLEVLFSPE